MTPSFELTHSSDRLYQQYTNLDTCAVFLDLSKAFDRVWHDGLLYKLEFNKISGNLLLLIKIYLCNRKQRVVLNGETSDRETITLGVPQGSVLGPLFSSIYNNDLVMCNINHLLTTHHYSLLSMTQLERLLT